ncbi:MAG: arylsulfatase [bacterium]|nr:arylsulfatase [bacterium]
MPTKTMNDDLGKHAMNAWRISYTTLLMLCFSVANFAHGADDDTPPQRPNVLLIMVDDLGYSDLGCYGSEIETPNLDALAANGLRFSQFYNTAKCHSSRVSLLTGQYCIAAGDTSLAHAVTSAEVLQADGYFTAMSGKWHLDKQPTDFGFQRYFGHLSGACNYFRGDNTFRLNGEPWIVPDKDFYTTVADVDYAMQFLNEAEETTDPWFLYLAFNAPHAPLQALPEDYAKYKGRYDEGWDKIREQRVQRQHKLGLLPKTSQPSERPAHIPAWETLTEKRKGFENKRMTALAGMIDRVDQEVGRLIEHLNETGELDNTLIWFVSDNGACPYDRVSQKIEAEPTSGDVSWSDSTGWAWARNSPFRLYKQNQTEGGINTPAIVHWPAGLKTKAGSIERSPAHLIDILPTIADAAGSTIPTTFADRDLRPVSGQSLLPIFEGKTINREQPIHLLFSSDRGLRDGDWKIVSFRQGPWELYNIATDRTEQHNLAHQNRDRLTQMALKWNEIAKEVLHTQTFDPKFGVPSDNPVSMTATHPEWTDFSVDPQNNVRGGTGRKKTPKSKANTSKRANGPIRARKNTQLQQRESELHLTFTGDDPGIAIDHLPENIPPGPYRLAFDLLSEAEGNGEVFYTTRAEQSLPKGQHIPIEIESDGQWHSHTIALGGATKIYRLRLDVSEGKGLAQIRGLRLLSSQNEPVIRWPITRTKVLK